MTIAGSLFTVLVTGVSFRIFRKAETMEKAELTGYVLFIVWGSLFLFGLFPARIS